MIISCIRRLKNKMSMLLNLIYRFSAISIKILIRFLVEIDKLNLELVRKSRRPIIAKITFTKKNKVEDLYYVTPKLTIKL